MINQLQEKLQESPIIAAVNDLSRLEAAIKSPCQLVFLLKGDIFNLKETVTKVQGAGKDIYIHLDLLEGFSKDLVALKYISQHIKPQGIITTKANLIKQGKELGFAVIQRIFVFDSLSLETGLKGITAARPHGIEVLPGVIPKTLRKIQRKTNAPIIASGLIEDKEDVIASLNAGTMGISTSQEDVWYM